MQKECLHVGKTACQYHCLEEKVIRRNALTIEAWNCSIMPQNLWKKLYKQRIRKTAEVNEIQMGCTSRKVTTDAIFAMKQLIEKYGKIEKGLYFVFAE